jgi:hypothetical protein
VNTSLPDLADLVSITPVIGLPSAKQHPRRSQMPRRLQGGHQSLRHRQAPRPAPFRYVDLTAPIGPLDGEPTHMKVNVAPFERDDFPSRSPASPPNSTIRYASGLRLPNSDTTVGSARDMSIRWVIERDFEESYREGWERRSVGDLAAQEIPWHTGFDGDKKPPREET